MCAGWITGAEKLIARRNQKSGARSKKGGVCFMRDVLSGKQKYVVCIKDIQEWVIPFVVYIVYRIIKNNYTNATVLLLLFRVAGYCYRNVLLFN
jgi:hypothetical protein